MKKKSLFYLTISIFGIVLTVSSIILNGKVSDTVNGILIGVGAGMIGIGFSMYQFFHWEQKNPEKWKQYEIESNDERNIIIKFKAKAVAGEILQWAIMAVAWAAIFLNASLWVILVAIGIFLFKTILEIYLIARYQKEM